MSRWPLALLGLALTTFAAVALIGPGRIDIEDGQARFEAGRNLLAYGEPSIRDPRAVWHRFPGRGGEDFTYYRFPGEFVAAAFIGIADITGPAIEGREHFIFSLNGAATAAALAVLFAVWFRKQGLSDQGAVLWAAAGIFCTPCWYYAASTFDDLLGTFAVVAALVAADRAREGSFFWLVASALAVGLALNCKQPLAAVLLPAMALADSRSLPIRPRLTRAIVLALGFIGGYAAYRAYDIWKFPPEAKALHAAIMAEKGLAIFGGNPLEACLDYAIGPSSGALWYSPTVILSVAGLAGWWQSERKIVVAAMAAASAAMVVFFSLLVFYKGGVCWGPRYLTPVFAMLWLFAPAGAARIGRSRTILILLLGATVQLLALSIVPERIYVERRVPSWFYRDDPWLYFESSISHLLQRPREIADALRAPAAPEFTPGPTPTFTMPVFDPPDYNGPKGIEGVRRYTLLNGFRPWWAAFEYLPAEQRPIALGPALAGFIAAAILGLLLTAFGLQRVKQRKPGGAA